MSLSATLRNIDLDASAALLAIGTEEAATYTAPTPGAVAVACTIYPEDVSVEGTGDLARSVAPRRFIRIPRAYVAQPVQGGVVVDADAVSWRLASCETHDEGSTTWVASRVRA